MSVLKALEKAYHDFDTKGYDRIYWAIDMHGTCIKSNYRERCIELINDDVIRVLKLISSLPESVLILYTCAHMEDAMSLAGFFGIREVHFTHFNANSEIKNSKTAYFGQKFYFSIMLDDKAGFDPETDWKIIEEFLNNRNASN